jgi:hypothetical protein
MKKRKNHWILAIGAFLILLVFSEAVVIETFKPKIESQENSLQKYLPPGDIDVWGRNYSSEEYEGENLYLYINGGAEIYHEFGFQRVLVQDYKNDNDKSISLELYEMTDPESAFGIYTFKRGDSGDSLALGNEGSLEDYYLNFWKGRFLVTITGFDRDEETIKGLKTIAKAVDDLIPDSCKPPDLVGLLPDQGLEREKIKYFKGHLALFNNYPFFSEDIFSLKRGVRGSYSQGFSLFVFEYPGEEERQKIFLEAVQKFRQSDRYQGSDIDGVKDFIVLSPEGERVALEYYRNYILIVFGDFSVKEKTDVVDRFKERLGRTGP